jgi:hypothetical protein
MPDAPESCRPCSSGSTEQRAKRSSMRVSRTGARFSVVAGFVRPYSDSDSCSAARSFMTRSRSSRDRASQPVEALPGRCSRRVPAGVSLKATADVQNADASIQGAPSAPPRPGCRVAPAEGDGRSGLREVQVVLERLLKKQDPAGDYATAIVRDAERPELQLAFENEVDAGNLASAVHADPNRQPPLEPSRRFVEVDGAMVAALAASLPLARPPARRPPETTDSWARIPHGSRASNRRSD